MLLRLVDLLAHTAKESSDIFVCRATFPAVKLKEIAIVNDRAPKTAPLDDKRGFHLDRLKMMRRGTDAARGRTCSRWLRSKSSLIQKQTRKRISLEMTNMTGQDSR